MAVTASVRAPQGRFRAALERIIPVRFRTKYTAISSVGPIMMPTSRAMQTIKDYFMGSYNKYQRYGALEELDSELQSGLSTASIVVAQSMKGFIIKPGEKLEGIEEELQEDLDAFYDEVLEPMEYDIAYKLFRDGDACYVMDKAKAIGIRDFVWLPMERLTVLEDKKDLTQISKVIQEANWYVLNEIPSISGYATFVDSKTQEFPADKVAHFNWGRKEKVLDLWGRETYGIFTRSPTNSLVPKLEGKLAAFLNDMLIKDVMVPREHHKLPSEAFNPDFFQGDNQEAKILAAMSAADTVLTSYAKSLEGRRVDRGYVTLDNVVIEIVEPKMAYNAPNEYIRQIDQSINRSMGTPESVLAGQTTGRGTFAMEVAVGAYLVMKAEFIAKKISKEFVNLAKIHLKIKENNKYTEHLDKIDFKLQLIFFNAEMARTVAILASLGTYTEDELRDKMGDMPLREDQREHLVQLNRGFVKTPGQEAAGQAGKTEPVKEPVTPESSAQQSIT